MGLVHELLLGDKRIGVEPLKQVCGVGSDDLHLREMDVRIDQARQQQMGSVVDDAGPGIGDAVEQFALGDGAVEVLDLAVLEVAVDLVVVEVTEERRVGEASWGTWSS